MQFDLLAISGEASPTFGHANANFLCLYCRPYKEPISKEINNDNHLNLHFHDQMLGWLRYCSRSVASVWLLGILVTGACFCAHVMGNNNSVKRIAAALGGVCFFLFFCASYII